MSSSYSARRTIQRREREPRAPQFLSCTVFSFYGAELPLARVSFFYTQISYRSCVFFHPNFGKVLSNSRSFDGPRQRLTAKTIHETISKLCIFTNSKPKTISKFCICCTGSARISPQDLYTNRNPKLSRNCSSGAQDLHAKVHRICTYKSRCTRGSNCQGARKRQSRREGGGRTVGHTARQQQAVAGQTRDSECNRERDTQDRDQTERDRTGREGADQGGDTEPSEGRGEAGRRRRAR